MSFKAGNFQFADALEAIEYIQKLMVDRAHGGLSDEEGEEYKAIRRTLIRDEEYREHLPRLVLVNADLGGVWSDLAEHSDQWEPRRRFVREQMRGVLQFAMDRELRTQSLNSSNWTGIQSPKERLVAAQKLLPLASTTVEALIVELEKPSGNFGPPLEDRQDAIDNLRLLHAALGDCLSSLESGAKSISQTALREAAGYLSRAARSLKSDPMPYMVAGGLAAMLSVIGAGGLGAFLSGIALTIRKNAGRD